MTIRQYLIIGTSSIFISCGTRGQQNTDDNKRSDNKTDFPIIEEAWMDFDSVNQLSFVDLYQYGRLNLPGRWKHSDGKPPRFFSYEDSENHILRLDRGLLDTMSFYSNKLNKTEILMKLREQGTAMWREKVTGQIMTIENNQDNVIEKLTIDQEKQIYFLCGLKENRTMILYLVPKTRDDLKDIELLKQIFKEWK